MGTVLVPVLVHHPTQHLATSVIVEVGINIREVDTVGIQETLEQQVILQGVNLGDAQAISHHRTSRRTTSGPHHHPQLLTGSLDEVGHNQEVARETHRLHHVQLKVDVLVDILRQGVAIQLLRSLVGEVAKVLRLKLDAVNLVVAAQAVDDFLALLGRQWILAFLIRRKLLVEVFLRHLLAQLLLRTKTLGDGEERHDGTVVDAVGLHLVEHLQGIGQRLGHIGENGVHLSPRLKPLLLGVAHTVRVVEVLARGDAEQMVVRLGSLLVLEVAVVGTNQLDAIFLGKLDEYLVRLLLQGESLAVGEDGRVRDLMALQLQVIVIAEDTVIPLASLPRPLDVPVENLAGHLAGDTGRTDDQVLVIFLQVGTVCTGTHIESVHPRVAHQLDQVFVTVVVFRQYYQVIATHVALVLLTIFLATACHIHLASDDGFERLQSLLLAVLVDLGAIVCQLLDAVHHTMVGDGQSPHAILDSLIYKVRNLGLSIEDGILRMHM